MITTNMPSSLNEWQKMFERIYGNVNATLSAEQIWMHVMEEAGEVARDMRKEDYDKLAQDLPDIFAWLCSFATQTGIHIEDAIWTKYPQICPYCLRKRNCVCISEGHATYSRRRLKSHIKNNHRPISLDSWENMFHEIFGNVNRILSRASIGFHLMEEIGEVASLLRRDQTEEYSIEIADVFAWLVAIPMKMPELSSLEQMCWSIYPNICKRCKRQCCGCDAITRIGPRF